MISQKLITHYDSLRVARNSPPEVIRAAYRALAQKYHPDRNPDHAKAERVMKIINAAYEVLSDPIRRQAHDLWIREQETLNAANEMRQVRDIDRPPQQFRSNRDVGQGSVSDGGQATWLSLSALPFILGAVILQRALVIAKWILEKVVSIAVFIFVVGMVIGLIAKAIELLSPRQSPEAAQSIAVQSRTAPIHASQPQVTFEDVSRCFWVYAPIVQVGQDFQHSGLFDFGQMRMRWYEEFLNANKKNPALKTVFETGIQRHKEDGLRRQETLERALVTQNEALFRSVVDTAIVCDKTLTIETSVIPNL